jgi:hypothetical protein
MAETAAEAAMSVNPLVTILPFRDQRRRQTPSAAADFSLNVGGGNCRAHMWMRPYRLL